MSVESSENELNFKEQGSFRSAKNYSTIVILLRRKLSAYPQTRTAPASGRSSGPALCTVRRSKACHLLPRN